jgi:tetratricopeptide (TPR) repeat protein
VADALNNLAALYQAQGRYADAVPLFKRCLAIREKARGPNHPDVANALNNLAGIYQAQGRYADAEPLFKRSLAIREKARGPNHPDVANALNNLAGLYQRQGRYADAEGLYKRALVIREKALGPDHPDVAASLNNLADLYRAQGRYAGAGAETKPGAKTARTAAPNPAVAECYKRSGGSYDPVTKRVSIHMNEGDQAGRSDTLRQCIARATGVSPGSVKIQEREVER